MSFLCGLITQKMSSEFPVLFKAARAFCILGNTVSVIILM